MLAYNIEMLTRHVDRAYRLHAWGDDHATMHIGGTMRPIQNAPLFNPATSVSRNISVATFLPVTAAGSWTSRT